jgi:cellobiose dehydrogenase (acceptor)
VTGTCGVASGTSVSSMPVPTGDTYDYIVVGGGAGGIPIADKLSEAGKKVLLIEKGPPSSGRWGGNLKPSWLAGTNLTRFDVPGLCNQIWVDSAGIACTDTDQMAGCVLGGGTAVNAGLWWKVSCPYAWQTRQRYSIDMLIALHPRLGLQLPLRVAVRRHGWCDPACLLPHSRHRYTLA